MIGAIVFSNNSPVLLGIFLESLKHNDIKMFNLSVLFKSDENTDSEYLSLFEKYGITSFVKENNFKEDFLNLLNNNSDSLISFFKDTNYFFSGIPEIDIEQIMTDQDMFCFSLSLGKNITHCYHNDVYNILLNDEKIGENAIKWNWVKHYLDFGRPLELGAGHIFHKKEIGKLFKKWDYNTIQGLEDSFDKLDYYPKELMSGPEKSVMIDVVSKEENPSEVIIAFDFSKLDRKIIEI